MASWAEDAEKLDTPARLTVLSLYRGRRLEGMSPYLALSDVYGVMASGCMQAVLHDDQQSALRRARQASYALVLKNRLAFRESPAMRRLRRL